MAGKSPSWAPSTPALRFYPDGPNRVWVIDGTLIRTYEDRLCLAVVVDLSSRQVGRCQ